MKASSLALADVISSNRSRTLANKSFPGLGTVQNCDQVLDYYNRASRGREHYHKAFKEYKLFTVLFATYCIYYLKNYYIV